MAIREHALASFYLDAKRVLVDAGYDAEIEWQLARQFRAFSESDFLRELAWVVFSSGFREAVVRQRFPRITSAFLQWETAAAIHENRSECRARALVAFNNPKKIDAVLATAAAICADGFACWNERISQRGVAFLMELPQIGPITAFHLAKNIGLDVVKPDRHLARAARAAGFGCALDLCLAIHRIVGDPVAVVDVVIWRYATLNKTYPTELAVATRS